MISEFAYGEFLFWSPGGNVAYVNAVKDDAYNELSELLRQRFSSLRKDRMRSAEVLQPMFGPVACDPDSTGESYVMDALPPCKHCKSRRIASWDLINPAKVVEWDIPVITHHAWNQLSLAEKLASIDRYIAREGLVI